jgi:hypothetical protein
MADLPPPPPTRRKVDRRPIAVDDVCPICYDCLSESDVAWCTFGCGGNFHVHCVVAWLDAKAADGEPGTCPICRSEIERPVIVARVTSLPPEVNRFLTAARAMLTREQQRIEEQQRRMLAMLERQNRARRELQMKISAKFGRTAQPKVAVRIPELFT